MRTIAVLAIILAATLLVTRRVRRKTRAASLRQEEGTWVWTGFDGRERRDAVRPDGPDGAWRSESWVAGMGLGFGGDGWDIGDASVSGDTGDTGDGGDGGGD